MINNGVDSDQTDEFISKIRTIEKKWQDEWETSHTFEADPDPKIQKYYITVPFPYPTGPLHIGHGRTYTMADIDARYRRLKGYNVLFPMGFHITGSPVESIAARIHNNDKNFIDIYKSYLSLYIKNKEEIENTIQSFKDPWDVVTFFSNVIDSDFKSLGYSIDWRRSFTTGDKLYSSFVGWQFNKLNGFGCISKGKYPVMYSTNEHQAVGEDDISGGDEINPEIEEYTCIKFKLNITDANTYLLCATLRPETIYGVTNIWINPEIIYVKVAIHNEIWILSEIAAKKLLFQIPELTIMDKITVEEIITSTVTVPDESDRTVPILAAMFILQDTGTGIVMSVPAHSIMDYLTIKNMHDVKINPIPVVEIDKQSNTIEHFITNSGITEMHDKAAIKNIEKELYSKEFYNGIVVYGIFKGLKVSDAKIKTEEWLIKNNNAFVLYEIKADKMPVVTRSGSQVVVAVVQNQWFIDYSDKEWKNKAYKLLDRMNLTPDIYRKTLINIFGWLEKRPCARERGIGTRLPFDNNWIIEPLSDSTIYMAFYTISHRLKKINVDVDKLNDTFWEYIFLGNGDIDKISKDTFVTKNDIELSRNEFLYWYPLDHRHTATGHISNHISFFIFHHAIIFPEHLWPKSLTINEFVICEGNKMSKSKGNIIPLVDISRKYSADLFRIYMAGISDLESIVDWKEENVKNFSKLLIRLDKIVEQIINKENDNSNGSLLSKLLNSVIGKLVVELEMCYTNYNYNKAVKIGFSEMLNYAEYYMRYAPIDYDFMNALLNTWITVISPIIPHLSEEWWHKLGNKTFISKTTWPEIESYDNRLIIAFKIVDDLIFDINNIQKILKKEEITDLTLYIADEWKYDLYGILSKNNPKSISDAFKISKEYTVKYGKEAENIITNYIKSNGNIKYTDRIIEKNMAIELKQMISERTRIKNINISEQHDETNMKYKRALPGKPALFIV